MNRLIFSLVRSLARRQYVQIVGLCFLPLAAMVGPCLNIHSQSGIYKA